MNVMKTRLEKELEKKDCHDCAAKPGQLHFGGCDTERCPKCGGQIIGCDCFTDETWPADADRLPWTGIWPGVLECIEFGWYSKWVPNEIYEEDVKQYGIEKALRNLGADRPGRWVPCGANDPDAGPNLNRLCGGEATWDQKLKRWTLQG